MDALFKFSDKKYEDRIYSFAPLIEKVGDILTLVTIPQLVLLVYFCCLNSIQKTNNLSIHERYTIDSPFALFLQVSIPIICSLFFILALIRNTKGGPLYKKVIFTSNMLVVFQHGNEENFRTVVHEIKYNDLNLEYLHANKIISKHRISNGKPLVLDLAFLKKEEMILAVELLENWKTSRF